MTNYYYFDSSFPSVSTLFVILVVSSSVDYYKSMTYHELRDRGEVPLDDSSIHEILIIVLVVTFPTTTVTPTPEFLYYVINA